MKVIHLIITIILLAILPSIGYGQKVKLKDVKVKANVISLPEIGLPIETTTYEVDANVDNFINKYGYGTESLAQIIQLPGYHKVVEGGDIKIVVNLGRVPISSYKDQNSKDKNGKVSYWTELTYANEYSYQIQDKNGVVVHDGIFTKWRNTKTYRSKKFKKQSELKSWKRKSDIYYRA